jgi:two-component system OmpR family sensor kinase
VLRSLRARLWLAILLASLVPLAALLVAGVALAERGVESADLDALVRADRTLAAIFDRWGAQTLAERQAVIDAVASFSHAQLYVVQAAETGLIIDPGAGERAVKRVESSGKIVKNGTPYLYAVVPRGNRAIILMREYGHPQYNWQAWTATLGVTAVLAVITAIAASLVFSRQIVRPVQRVAAASHKLAAGESPTPLKEQGPEELRSLAQSFNTMAAQLDEARMAERDFLLLVTHELKTPVAAVRGYAEAQRDGVVEPAEAEEIIINEASRLERLVQDLLDLGRLSRHKFSVRHESVDLAAAARAAAAGCEPLARELGIDLHVSGPSSAVAVADYDRVVQVVRNLIENALRFSQPGGKVTVVVAPGKVEVTDEGPGLNHWEVRKAFDRFFLYRRYRGQRAVGTGLGLSIVKELAEAMGGTVSVESTLGKGATFRVTLPEPPGAGAGVAQGGQADQRATQAFAEIADPQRFPGGTRP